MHALGTTLRTIHHVNLNNCEGSSHLWLCRFQGNTTLLGQLCSPGFPFLPAAAASAHVQSVCAPLLLTPALHLTPLPHSVLPSAGEGIDTFEVSISFTTIKDRRHI